MLAPALALLVAASSASAGPLDLPKGDFKIETVRTIQAKDWTETVLRYPSPVKSPWPRNDAVWAHLMIPRSLAAGRKAPAVLILPVMAAPNVWIETRFANRFARDGFVVMWLEMPTQFHRRPLPSEPSGQVFLARTTRQLAANFRQSVLDARRSLGVLSARPEVDAQRVALFGISLGAIVSSVVYTVDPRPRFAALLLGGAGFPSLLINSSLTGPFARKMGIGLKDLQGAWAGWDPSDHPERNAGKPALLVNAGWDTVIPRANAAKLRAAFPAARQYWVPGGHYTSIVHLFWLPGWVSGKLQEALKAPAAATEGVKNR